MLRALAPLGTALVLLVPALHAQTDAGNDFTPGDRVLYVDNFARVPLGMVPRNLKLTTGNIEVAKVGERFVLRVTADPTQFSLALPAILPERFTIEYEIAVPEALGWDQSLYLVPPDNEPVRVLHWGNQAGVEDRTKDPTAWYASEIPRADASQSEADADGATRPPRWDRIQVMGDGNFIKVYANGTRVANVPSVNLGRSSALHFEIRGDQKDPVLLAGIRVAAGGKDLYRALMEDGQVTLEGLEFDTGKDVIRPASDSILMAVAAALASKADLALLVQGHTDDVGDAAANLALSERRAKAVVTRLVALGLAPNRLRAEGLGETQPIASNGTPEGRQRNRRVLLLRDY